MSSIPPPNVIGSVLQSGVAQGEQARQTDADKNAQAEAARKTAGNPMDVLEVEATDGNHQVNTEAEGQGSQGRYDGAPEDTPPEEANSDGVTIDDDGTPHVDLSA